MNNLFIIGNGFDLAHNIESKYEHFKSYLKSNFPDEISNWKEEDSFNGDISEDSGMMFRLLFKAIDRTEGGEWSNLEETLGVLDYDDFLRCNGYQNDDILLETLESRTEVFREEFDTWVNEISIEKAKKKVDFAKFIGVNDLFINFNYTRTLEDVYNVDEGAILHIHGVSGDRVEFGHGADHRDLASEGERSIHEKFRKSTDGIVEKHGEFLKKRIPAGEITQIYAFGFSYGYVDQVYLREIFKGLGDTRGITWFFNSFDIEREEEFKEILEECGFNGKHARYTVES
ncbi:bacteriophage abortive infection AbiH family protein [Bacillus toyonensis]|uniref:bacteriophage abortive infection AbiH family protein n=1 Tax=Bacillus cereus group TaxID=86661 RepID=UPI000B5EDE91|nr:MULTISPECIES: bacteriophage abortive infection AbiH family protein [Bacillus cereus group]ASL62721.1 hypothetical protein FORC47_p369 [Bacillus cereus]MCH5455724.1 bacteriophage abortive infection AbiH family protein [Bacillus toyonensis]HDR7471926.1 bacteriophage abortive infection AbiH family protein [Bacillus toyonensis]